MERSTHSDVMHERKEAKLAQESSVKAVLSATEAAYYLGLSESTIRKLVSVGKMPFRRQGDRLLFIIQDLDLWVNSLMGLSAAEAIRLLRGVDDSIDTLPLGPEPTSVIRKTSKKRPPASVQDVGHRWPVRKGNLLDAIKGTVVTTGRFNACLCAA